MRHSPNKASIAQRRFAQCLGKTAFASAALAHAIKQRRRKALGGLASAYHCPHCNFWHQGTDSRKVHNNRKKHRLSEGADRDDDSADIPQIR